MSSFLRLALMSLGAAVLLAVRPAALLPPAHAQNRFQAPELDGAVGTIGADKPILLKDLRGKIVVIEFWTLC